MLSLKAASETLEFENKTGKFSDTFKLVLSRFSKEEEEKYGKAQTQRPQLLNQNETNVEEDEIDIDEINTESTGLVEYSSNTFKWLKKIVKVNFLNVTLHLSILMFLRELSFKQKNF